MTHREGKAIFLQVTPPAKCDLCPNVDELRPYGPNGANVCFYCAMKDREGTERRMFALLAPDLLTDEEKAKV